MKKTLKLRMASGIRQLFLSVMLTGSLNVAGQISVAPNPVTAGTFGSSFSYSNTQNSQNYGNYYGRSTNDVAYKFTLTTGMNMVISNCGSSVSDTYLYLLNASGNGISSNDDYSGTGACSNTYHSRIAQTLPAGTYYVISEGYSSNGSITTSITGTAAGISGNTFQSPISAGSFSAAFSYSNTQNTTGFTNTFGRPANDVFYRFSVSVQMDVTITHCGSSLSDTYMYLLDVNGNSIDSNDDYSGTGACSNTYNSVIKKTLSAGTYYIVSEGYSSNGLIITNITGTSAVNNMTGNTFQNPIVMGTYGSAFNYSNSQNTVSFTNTYGQSSNDVFYKLTLSVPMTVTINHCNSTLSDTYLHLLDAGGNRIAYNDDYSGTGACSSTYRSYLKKELGAGIYYVVSEGYSSNGVIVTAVTGEQLQAAGIEYLYDAGGNRTARHPIASMFSAVSNLRSSEIKYNKEGIISDPGRDASKDEVKQVNSAIDIAVEAPAFAVKIYPNPTDGQVTVSIPDYRTEKKGEIRLYDFAGRNLYTGKIASETEIIDLSGYTAGMYTIKVSIDGKTTVHKIIRNGK